MLSAVAFNAATIVLKSFSSPGCFEFWQVINCAWDRGLSIAGQNVLPCYDRESFSKMVEMAKPKNHPDKRYLSFFAYQQHSPGMMQKGMCIPAFDYFVKCMHGKHLL